MKDADKSKEQLIEELLELRRQVAVFKAEAVQREHTEEIFLKEKSISDVTIDSLPGVFYIFNDQGRYLRWNKNHEIVTGYSTEEIGRMHPLDFFKGEDKQKIAERIQDVFVKGEAVVEANFVLKSGDKIPYLFTGRRIMLDDNLCLVGMGIDITVRKRAEELVRQSRREWKDIFQAIGHPTIILDPEHKIIEVNRTAAKAIRDDEREILGRKCYEVFHNSDRPAAGCPIDKMLNSNELETIEMEMEALGGVFLVSCTPMLDDAGNLEKIIHIATDISERRQAEEENKLNQLRLESILRISQYEAESITEVLDYALDQAIFLTGSKIGYLYFYEEDKKQFILNNWSRDVMEECTVVEPQSVYSLDNTGLWGEAVRQAKPIIVNDFQAAHPLKKGYPVGHATLLKFLTIPIFSHSRIVAVVGVGNKKTDYDDSDVRQLTLMMDTVWKIVEQRKAEEALNVAHQKFQTIFQTSPLGIFVLNPEGKVTMWNQAAETTFGWTATEAVGRFLPIVQEDKLEDFRNNLQRALSGDFLKGVEVQRRKKDGSLIDLKIFTAPLVDNQGKVIGVMALNEDITEQKMVQEALRKSEEQYRLLVNQIPAVVFKGYADWSVDFFDNKIETLTGYPKEAFDSKLFKWNDLIIAEDHEEITDKFIKALKNSRTYTREYRIRKKDGQIAWIQTQGQIFCDTHGKIDYISGVLFDITEHKQAEEALRISEEKYRALIETTDTGFVILDIDGLVMDANQEYIRLTGHSDLAGIWGRSVLEWTAKEDYDRNSTEVKKCLETGTVRNLEIQYVNRHGQYIPIEINATVIKTGNQPLILAVCRDITERKRTDALFKLNEMRLEALLHLNQMTGASLQDITHFAMEEATRLTGSKIGYLAFMNENETVLTMHAWSKSAMADCRILEKSHSYPVEVTGLWGEAVRQRRAIITNDYAAPNPWKKTYPEGHVHIKNHMNAPIFDGNRIVIVAGVGNKDADYDESDVRQLTLLMEGMWRIIQRKRADEALSDSEEKYRLLVNNVPAVVFKGYADGSVDFFDDKIEKLTGYLPEEFNSKKLKWIDIIFPEDRLKCRQAISAALQADRSYVREYRIRPKDNKLIWLEEKSQIICDHRGRIAYISGLFFDKSATKLLEDQLIKAQKMEAVGLLAGGVAHDFNNLLTTIIGYCDIMLMELHQADPFSSYLQEIVKATNHGTSLTSQLLAFSRKQIMQPKIFDLNTIVIEMDKMLKRLIGEDIELVSFLSTEPCPIKADPGQIEQIIMNLAVNARDAMPSGGKLTIETKNVYLDEPYTLSHVEVNPGSYIMLAVSDIGEGMDQGTLSHIFEPFFTTKKNDKGTGLGLATVYGIVKQSGGHIWLYSELGQGTTFKIFLPKVSGDIEAIKSMNAPHISLNGDETVLVVEDDTALRKLICQSLRKFGYKALEAGLASEALLICNQEKYSIHLMLTDVVMPHMSGRELVERLATLHPEIKVLYMSGYTENAIVHHGVLDSKVNFIQKPFKVLSMVQKVREVIDSSRPF